jgi:hypothetical protein
VDRSGSIKRHLCAPSTVCATVRARKAASEHWRAVACIRVSDDDDEIDQPSAGGRSGSSFQPLARRFM